MSRLSACRFLFLAFLCAAALPARSQSVSVIGAAGTLDVGAWNIKQFQDADPQMANVVRIIRESAVDIWSLEEITSGGVLDALLSKLGPDWGGRLSSSSNLFTAFVYRTDAIRVRRVSTILEQYSSEFAGRPPLMLEADATLPDTTIQLRLISLHMKCCSDANSYDRRKAAADALKNRIDFLYGADRVIVMGDFNDETGNSITFGRPSPFEAFVTDPEYRFLIEDLSVGTYCGSSADCRTGSTIDNILITQELHGNYLDGSGDRFEALLQEVDRYVYTTSDHLPVTARFAFVNSTATEPLTAALDGAVWPLPAASVVHLRVQFGDRVTVSDLLGRQLMARNSRGSDRLTLDVSGLPTGLYLVTLHRGTQAFTTLLPVAR